MSTIDFEPYKWDEGETDYVNKFDTLLDYLETTINNVENWDNAATIAQAVLDVEQDRMDVDSALAIVTAEAANAAASAAAAATSADSILDYAAAQSTNFNAVVGNHYPIDTSGGVVTMTFPASPSVGDKVGIQDVGGSFADNNLTLGRNGLKVFGESEDGTVSRNNISIVFVYEGTTLGWIPL